MKQILILLLICSVTSCKKFLDEKPDKKLVTPSTLSDLQAILDNTLINRNDPYSPEMSADNYYLPTDTWNTLDDYDRRMYTWEKDNIFSTTGNDWSNIYTRVYYANTVLESIEKIERNATNKYEWDNIKGQALMVRGNAFLNAVLIWSPAYDNATAATDLGIPLRITADFTQPATRPSVQQTYDRIISDLTESVSLLPPLGIHPSRASKAAACALLARTFLSIRNYNMAGLYADSSLQINSSLMNYNTLNTVQTYPVPQFNPEITYYSGYFTVALYISYALADTLLYSLYDSNDCRKSVFFKPNANGTMAYRGSYDGSNGGNFSGIATDELYLVRAESFARAGNKQDALNDLNTLLQMRFKTGTFIPAAAGSSQEALTIILLERRKELIFRGLRWMDIKRLNKEAAAITLNRFINNQLYTLPANDLRYAMPVPEYVIGISGMPQNPR
jgi:hypothetical protein